MTRIPTARARAERSAAPLRSESTPSANHPTEPEVASSSPHEEPDREVVIVLSDELIDVLGTLFSMSPARKAMTFEAYLIVRGFAR